MNFYRKKWFWILAIIIIIILFFVIRRSGSKKTAYITDEVKRANIVKTVTATGTAKAPSSFNLAFPSSGVVEAINVQVGDIVEKGQVLAKVDEKPLFYEKEKAKASYEGGLESAQLDLAAAQEDINNTLKVNKEKLDQAHTKVNDAEDYLDSVEDWADKVEDESGESSSTYKAAHNTLTAAENSYKEAKDNEALVKKEVALDEANARQTLRDAEETLSQKSKELASSTLSYNYASYLLYLDSFKKGVLKAPVSGIITGKNNEIGEITGPTHPIISMISEGLEIKVNIPEADITKISIGREARITFDAFSEDKVSTGKITEIEPAETLISDVVYYKATIVLDNNDSDVKPGMTANIAIQVASRGNVLSVPEIAVNEKNGESFVNVLKNGKSEKVRITTGISGDDGRVEIISGLNENDKVIISNK